MEFKGIDVSSYQGKIFWPAVSFNNIHFAMIRSTFGKRGIDSQFIRNINNIKLTNILAGAYHYCLARSTSDAITEANHFINTVKNYKLNYPLALNMTDESIVNLSKKIITDIIIVFCDIIKNNNFHPVLFTNINWINNHIEMNRIPDLDIWLSEFTEKPSYTKNVTIWQYSQDGKIFGIDTASNMDTSYKDYGSILNNNNLNNKNNNNNILNNNNNNLNDLNYSFYNVKKGDTLGSIAQNFLGNSDRYKEIMDLNDLTNDALYIDQVLRIPKISDNGSMLYRVKKGDTLWNLSKRFLNIGTRYREIMDLNGLTNDMIYPGQILKILKLDDTIYKNQ